MNAFEYYNPVKVIFKENSVDCIGKEAAAYGNTALIVSYKDVSFFGDLFEIIHNSLKQNNIRYFDFFEVTANPTINQAKMGVEFCKKNNIDIVIGVGGGSAMDCAKVIAAGVLYGHDITRMISFSHSSDFQIPPEKALPLLMIPTLPATGSEMNPTAVITNEETMQKSYVWAPQCLYPKVAVVDPVLTKNLPAYQTACGAIDTIAHMLEGYFNGTACNLDIQDRMMEGVITAILENVEKVLKNPHDTETRGVMQWASIIALNGWVLSGTYTWAPMHQMGHVLGARYNATHGATLAAMIIAWMRFFSARSDNKRYVQFAQRIFNLPLNEAANEFENLCKKLGVQTRITQFGVTEKDIDQLAADVEAVSFNRDGLLGSSPCLTKADVKEIYRIAL